MICVVDILLLLIPFESPICNIFCRICYLYCFTKTTIRESFHAMLPKLQETKGLKNFPGIPSPRKVFRNSNPKIASSHAGAAAGNLPNPNIWTLRVLIRTAKVHRDFCPIIVSRNKWYGPRIHGTVGSARTRFGPLR